MSDHVKCVQSVLILQSEVETHRLTHDKENLGADQIKEIFSHSQLHPSLLSKRHNSVNAALYSSQPLNKQVSLV